MITHGTKVPPLIMNAATKTHSRYLETRTWYLIAMSIFRIGRPDDDQVDDVDSLVGVERTISSGKPGRYHVDEFSHDPLPSGHTVVGGGSESRVTMATSPPSPTQPW
jgi:hypothetical protein